MTIPKTVGTRARRSIMALAVAALLTGVLPATPSAAAAGKSVRHINSGGETSFRSAPLGSAGMKAPEFPKGVSTGAAAASARPAAGAVVNRSQSEGAVGRGSAADSAQEGNSSSLRLLKSFDGLTEREQRLARGAN